ncbi:STAS domain-containing protein [Fusibacter bizertensis]|uniref:Anti-sigma factor antagonist n=1 Tax=Fusibacter bizertensis TaxID=1488331 RepID=A0ABT6NA52_9FIRM|nr:STAS domain-containing protein [Fusibacter bizertensis]MDH8677292.1 STAS domain-containing protein [Fusibacter bizertensis]
MKMEIIKMPEQFSVQEAAKFREMAYNLLAAEPTSFELDFSVCYFIDSTGLGVLVGLYKKCKEMDCKIVLKHLQKDVARVFSMTRLDQIFTIL